LLAQHPLLARRVDGVTQGIGLVHKKEDCANVDCSDYQHDPEKDSDLRLDTQLAVISVDFHVNYENR
jgi:hypothetical protein